MISRPSVSQLSHTFENLGQLVVDHFHVFARLHDAFPLFHLFIVQQALVKQLGEALMVQFLPDENQFLSPVAPGSRKVGKDALSCLSTLWPVSW